MVQWTAKELRRWIPNLQDYIYVLPDGKYTEKTLKKLRKKAKRNNLDDKYCVVPVEATRNADFVSVFDVTTPVADKISVYKRALIPGSNKYFPVSTYAKHLFQHNPEVIKNRSILRRRITKDTRTGAPGV